MMRHTVVKHACAFVARSATGRLRTGFALGVCASAYLVAALHGTAFAQDAPRATGALIESAELYRTFEKTPIHRAFLPESVDLRDRMPKPRSQGDQSSCVGWATAYAARSYYVGTEGNALDRDSNITSPGFLYHAVRPSASCGEGSYVTDALDFLRDQGALSLAEFPYDDSFCARPTDRQLASADRFRIKDWLAIDLDNFDQIKGSLARGHPVVISAWVNDDFSYVTDAWDDTGPITDDDGGHAMVAVGYDDRRGSFLIQNSWGDDWGNGGFIEATYDTFRHRVMGAYQMVPFEDPPKPNAPEEDEEDVDVSDVRLPDYECSSLVAQEESGVIEGFVSRRLDLASLEREFGGEWKIEVDLRPWPQCEALLIVGDVSGDGIGGADAPKIEVDFEFTEGDLLPLAVTTPNHSSHLHLAYFQADGSVVNLVQSSPANLATIAPSKTLRFGDGEGGRGKFKVSGPFGDELVLAVSTRSPLFPEERPTVETEREFLSALRAATIELEQMGIDRSYAADVAPIVTSPAQ